MLFFDIFFLFLRYVLFFTRVLLTRDTLFFRHCLAILFFDFFVC